MKGLFRKAGHVLADPVLRRWLVRRFAGLEKPPSGFVIGQPPYLSSDTDLGSDGSGTLSVADFPDGVFAEPKMPAQVTLPGATVELSPGDPGHLFDSQFDDLETQLAAHRFAWIPVAGDAVDRDWVAALWRAWTERFGRDEAGWPWHAYTAAERAINIIDFSRRFGLIGDRQETATMLSRHGEVIRANLEYFGDHYTSNHLSNNGRGLLRIGTALGRADFAAIGAKIMTAEAGRIFGRSGVLREGSTHYHQLITRNYIDAFADACVAGLEQSEMLRDIAARALAASPGLHLAGGMPLVGDISPDVPPDYLAILSGGERKDGWPGHLSEDRQEIICALVAESMAVSPDKLAEDGWHRLGGHRWQALTYVSPDGWPPMPGHGHRDLGSFELHDGETPIFVDPGRGSYADVDYESAKLHNGVQIDGAGPMPLNRAYYAPAFRHRIVPIMPSLRRTRAGGILNGAGFQHISGIASAEREWRFTDSGVSISDRITGRGRRKIQQQFCTPHPVETDGDAVIINSGSALYRLSTGGQIRLREITCWTAYGEGRAGTQIIAEAGESLPMTAEATLERIEQGKS